MYEEGLNNMATTNLLELNDRSMGVHYSNLPFMFETFLR